METAGGGQPEACRVLLDAKAQIDAADHRGRTALWGSVHMVKKVGTRHIPPIAQRTHCTKNERVGS